MATTSAPSRRASSWSPRTADPGGEGLDEGEPERSAREADSSARRTAWRSQCSASTGRPAPCSTQARAISETAMGSLGRARTGRRSRRVGGRRSLPWRAPGDPGPRRAVLRRTPATRARLHLRLEPGEGGLLDHPVRRSISPGCGHVPVHEPVRPDGDQRRQHLRPGAEPRRQLPRLAGGRTGPLARRQPRIELTLDARSIRAVSSRRSRSSDSGIESSSSRAARAASWPPRALRAPAPPGRRRRRAGGPLGLPGQVQVLGDQGRLGALCAERLRDRRGSPVARRAPASRRPRRA